MRIESGEKKGHILKSPKGIRPTTSFLKKSIFDMLGNYILDKEILELFAGSGALGLEALSRGAKSCTFVDISRSSQKAILDNIKNLGYINRTKFVKSEALKFLRNCNDKFDIIIADPPYNYKDYEKLLNLAHSKLKEGGILILQLSSKVSLEIENYKIIKDYKKGETRIIVLSVNHEEK
ncbi:MAG: 16S rRNA (guanine(966)-N(2))-methyltransferase RsmD [candidate division WOR-3 bacterium]|nr:16S rRNA (guanine(966)-N(2))-methyltransferase RsmD [candidate division WOR-3 bacterium]MCX7947174.1 16S rRNA (guanine(966)-N(2))-methyltransferase RsmD [candidate division WOR-3 bacterium]MDW8150230.1 16S rRNA (guanine(966)-N(2))-methyltransferase RsmD [candidate division WOR-3 bacterium]